MKPQISLWLEVEAACNLACRFCYNFWKDGHASTPRGLPTKELLKGLQHLLDKFDCRQVAVSGGEPLLRPDLDDIMQFLKRSTIPVVLTTNGTLLSATKADSVLQWGVETVQVSLHGANAQEHDWLSGGYSFRDAVRGLMLVRERGIKVAAVFVATLQNLHRFPDVLRLLARINVRTILFNRFIVSGLGVRNELALGVPGDDAILNSLHDAQAIASATGQTIILGTPVPADETTRRRLSAVKFGSCPVRQGQQRWTIGVDGAIRRCNHSSVSIGNILTDGIDRLYDTFLRDEASLPSRSTCDTCQLGADYFRSPSESGLTRVMMTQPNG
jgi:MoaA/NifB/PqqE/SkfB family radical SAM enzyme